MIQNDEQWLSTREAMIHLERGLAALHKDKAKIHPDRFVLMAAPVLEDLLRLRQQIDDYLGVTDTIRLVKEWEQAHPQAAPSADAENNSDRVRDTAEVGVH